MAPADKILTPSEMATARTMLQTKPPTISYDQFNIVKEQILDGTPQAEYILVGFELFFFTVHLPGAPLTSLTRSLADQLR